MSLSLSRRSNRRWQFVLIKVFKVDSLGVRRGCKGGYDEQGIDERVSSIEEVVPIFIDCLGSRS